MVFRLPAGLELPIDEDITELAVNYHRVSYRGRTVYVPVAFADILVGMGSSELAEARTGEANGKGQGAERGVNTITCEKCGREFPFYVGEDPHNSLLASLQGRFCPECDLPSIRITEECHALAGASPNAEAIYRLSAGLEIGLVQYPNLYPGYFRISYQDLIYYVPTSSAELVSAAEHQDRASRTVGCVECHIAFAAEGPYDPQQKDGAYHRCPSCQSQLDTAVRDSLRAGRAASWRDPVRRRMVGAILGLSLFVAFIVVFGSGAMSELPQWAWTVLAIVAAVGLINGLAQFYILGFGEQQMGRTVKSFHCRRCGTAFGGKEYRQWLRTGLAPCPECGTLHTFARDAR